MLEKGEVNLFEAEHLARVTAERLGATAAQAKRGRTELLSSQMQTRASGGRLRQRVNEMLRTSAAESTRPDAESDTEPVDLEDFDPHFSTHLFREQLKQPGFAFREIRREDVTEVEIEEPLKASEPILAILGRVRRPKEQTRLSK